MVGTLNPAGLERLVTELSIDHKRQGYEVAVCCLIEKTGAYIKLLNAKGIPVFDASYGNLPWLLLSRLSRVIRTWRPDIVHSHVNYSLVWQVGAILRTNRIPFIITQHTIFNPSISVRLRSAIIYRLIKQAVSKHIAVSSFSAQHAAKLYGINPGSIEIIPNGVNSDIFRFDAQARERLRQEWGIPEAGFVWGSVGRLDWVKGYDILVKAFAEAHRSFRNLYLVSAGDGPEVHYLKALCQDLGCAQAIKWVGVRGDIPQVLSAFDAYVQPSRTESAGLAILEALSNGLLVIASDVGGIPEIQFHAPQAITLTAPGDVAALEQVLLSHSERQSQRERAVVKCPAIFSFADMSFAYQRVYCEVSS